MQILELFLASASGLCGLLAAFFVSRGEDKIAGIFGGVGLFLCNVVWILRLK